MKKTNFISFSLLVLLSFFFVKIVSAVGETCETSATCATGEYCSLTGNPKICLASAPSCNCTISMEKDKCAVQGTYVFKVGGKIDFKFVEGKDLKALVGCDLKDLESTLTVGGTDLILKKEMCNGTESFFQSGRGYEIGLTCNLVGSGTTGTGSTADKSAKTTDTSNISNPTCANGGLVCLENPIKSLSDPNSLEGNTSINSIVGNIIKNVMAILGGLTLLIFVAGGFLWLTSMGNPEKVKKGTDTMLWAIVGLFIIFGSYAILSVILNAIAGK